MMIGYDIYDCFTMEHFRLRQKMTFTTKIYSSQLYVSEICHKFQYHYWRANSSSSSSSSANLPTSPQFTIINLW
jgi:hypothetical protein